jgi:hypothetical protein
MIHHCLGACERTHRTLAERLTPYIQKGKQWDNVLPAITFAINASVNSSTKYSPFQVVFGSRPKFPLHQHHTDFSKIPADYHDYVVTHSKNLGSIREEIKANALKSGELMVERYNKNANPLKVSVGDYVYMLAEQTGQGRKFQPKYTGPLVVHKIVSDHIVKLRNPSTGKPFRNDVHLDRLKIAYVRVPEPADYFLLSVRTNENAIESETANPDNALESEASKPNQADQHTSSSPSQPVRPNLRRTTRIRKRPVRFCGSSFNSEGSSSDGQTLTESDSYYKIKRVLTQRIRNGETEYQVQFKGEPAQNSIWIPFDQLNAYTQRAVRNKLPPRVE